ncbi:phosphodiesterase [Adlercreutzia sp. ZJ141]|uniref:phosphodiesterase n=1 Tax=Adlercreutzia sp. ZJ141 TaxID=2709406 RepID=UPI0013E9D8A1|nr:phosphodiesterase [Adlercreutzia sp. ZJ141]
MIALKLVIASDIHGSAYWCRKLVSHIHQERPDVIALLGDLLYHGPRNPLPRDYAPAEVAAMLNNLASRIVAVRGNCDSEVDQMMLSFPCMGDYALLSDGGAVPFRVEAGQGDACDDASGVSSTMSDGVADPVSDAASSTMSDTTSGTASNAASPVFPCRQLLLTHGHVFGPDNVPPHPASAAQAPIFAVVSGHTHVKQQVVRDGVLFVNPGSVSLPKDGSNSFMVYEDGAFEVRLLD